MFGLSVAQDEEERCESHSDEKILSQGGLTSEGDDPSLFGKDNGGTSHNLINERRFLPLIQNMLLISVM